MCVVVDFEMMPPVYWPYIMVCWCSVAENWVTYSIMGQGGCELQLIVVSVAQVAQRVAKLGQVFRKSIETFDAL